MRRDRGGGDAPFAAVRCPLLHRSTGSVLCASWSVREEGGQFAPYARRERGRSCSEGGAVREDGGPSDRAHGRAQQHCRRPPAQARQFGGQMPKRSSCSPHEGAWAPHAPLPPPPGPHRLSLRLCGCRCHGFPPTPPPPPIGRSMAVDRQSMAADGSRLQPMAADGSRGAPNGIAWGNGIAALPRCHAPRATRLGQCAGPRRPGAPLGRCVTQPS